MLGMNSTRTNTGPAASFLWSARAGAGKDTLLGLAHAACAEDRDVVFPRRVVTREASAFEDNEPASFEMFRQARACGELPCIGRRMAMAMGCLALSMTN